MARPESDARPQLSLLDRLFDDSRDAQEVSPNRFQAVRQYKDAVMRDLEWLLNSRANPEEAGDEFPELRESGYSYGLADFSSLRLSSSGDRTKLARAIQQTIELHEPRLTNVSIEMPEDVSMQKMKINFAVTALLDMAPAPEQISFETELELSRGSYQVKGG